MHKLLEQKPAYRPCDWHRLMHNSWASQPTRDQPDSYPPVFGPAQHIVLNIEFDSFQNGPHPVKLALQVGVDVEGNVILAGEGIAVGPAQEQK